MKHLYLVISALLATGSVIAAPSSAVLLDANGSVLVNQGKQFVSAKSGQLLTVGDRVMVMEGANASVRYADGCMLKLTAGSLVTVSSQSTCVAGQASVAQVAPMYAQAVGTNVDDGDCDGDGIKNSQDSDVDGDNTPNEQDDMNNCKNGAVVGRSNVGIWIVAAAAAIGAGVAISDGDDETVSP